MVGEGALDFAGILGEGVIDPVTYLYNRTVEVIPGIAIAIVLLIIGYVVALLLKKAVVYIIQYLKVDHFLESHELPQAIGGVPFSILLGELVKWYVVVIFLAQSVGFLSLDVLSEFIQMLVLEVPLILSAILLLAVGFYLARYVRNTINKTNYPKKGVLGLIAEIIVMYLVIVMALAHIGFDTTILVEAFRIAFTVLVIVIAVIFGVAFGLSFKKDIKNFVMEARKGF